MPKERIQKFLAHLGLGSRREIEDWIREHRVMINGVIAELGDQIDIADQVMVNGQPVTLTQHPAVPPRLIRFHKPEGVMCTAHDPQGRPTVFSYLPALKVGRWIMVGRLDFNTAGLLLFTTDGELAHRLMHPSTMIEREYAVRIFGTVSEDMLQRLQTGVMLEDGMAKFSSIQPAGGTPTNPWFDCILSEGRYREVRRLWASQDVQVSRLIRTRYGIFELNDLPLRHWEEVPLEQMNLLRTQLDLPSRMK
jgi:23S rRNA pseudouridine2605 synthase